MGVIYSLFLITTVLETLALPNLMSLLCKEVQGPTSYICINKLCCLKCPWLRYLALDGSICMQKFIHFFLFPVRLMHISCWQSDSSAKSFLFKSLSPIGHVNKTIPARDIRGDCTLQAHPKKRGICRGAWWSIDSASSCISWGVVIYIP